MKCPLLSMYYTSGVKAKVGQATDCLKEECAWWEDKLGKCSIRRIWIALQDINEVLHDIEKKMPTEVSFRK